MIGRSSFGFKQSRYCIGIAGISAKAVNGLGRESNQTALPQ
jgi:hypothetical protein